MDAKNAINSILQDATGNRASGREMLLRPKKSRLTPEAAAILKEQWKSAGRDNAQVVMLLSEEDGSNPHLVTGWNGRDTFVCMTQDGLQYVDHRKLDKLKVESRWDPTTRLIQIRAESLMEEEGDGLSSSDVKMLVDRIKKTLTKSSKKRRKGRLRNIEKFFSVFDEATNSEKAANSGPASETEMEEVKEKDDRIPESPKEPKSTKLPKDAKGKQTHRESLDWRQGWVPRHPMMNENATDPQLDKREHVRQDSEGKGSSPGATPGGNKTDPQEKLRQLVRMNRESKKYLESNSTDPQLDKREHVPIRREGGKWNQVASTPGGNKTDPQQKLRQLVRMNKDSGGYTEDRAMGAKDSSDKSDQDCATTYAGEKADKKEFASRPKIAVRHEDLDEAKKRFGPGNKKSPMGAKQPLLMMVLMGRTKKGKPAPKKNMSEGLRRTGLKLTRSVSESRLPNINKIRSRAQARRSR